MISTVDDDGRNGNLLVIAAIIATYFQLRTDSQSGTGSFCLSDALNDAFCVAFEVE